MIRLVERERPNLSLGAAKEAANNAYTRAKAAQRELATHLWLLELLHRPGRVSAARLRGEHREALDQVKRAQKVADALTDAMEALDAISNPITNYQEQQT